MKSILSVFTALLLAASWQPASATVPQQAQASNLAVPETPRYISALVIDQCRQVVSVIFTTPDGKLEPQHFQDLTPAQLFVLLSQVQADQTLEVTLPCAAESKT